MSPRQRGATLLLGLLLLGRLVDHFNLPIERSASSGPNCVGLDSVPAPPPRSRPAADSLVRPTPAAAAIPINTATARELQALPGVGPVLAQRIVDYRTAHGAFRSPEDLLAVSGIGERSAARLAPLLRFD